MAGLGQACEERVPGRRSLIEDAAHPGAARRRGGRGAAV